MCFINTNTHPSKNAYFNSENWTLNIVFLLYMRAHMLESMKSESLFLSRNIKVSLGLCCRAHQKRLSLSACLNATEVEKPGLFCCQ